MFKSSFLFLLIYFFFLVDERLWAQDLLVKSGHLFDPDQGKWLNQQMMLIRAGKIIEINPKIWPKNVQSLDLGQFYIIPGLIDAHTHLFLEDPTYGENFSHGLLSFYKTHSNAQRVDLAKKRSSALSKMGFTAIRDLGNDGGINIPMFEGARIYSSGPGHVPKLGQFPPGTPEKIVFKEYARLDETSFRNLHVGNRTTLKLYADEDPNPTLTASSVLERWVQRGHELGLKVAIHGNLPASIQTALDARPDSLEHGTNLSESQLRQMARQRTVWVPSTGPRALMAPVFKDIMPVHVPKELASICANISKAHKMGVKMVFGSDNYLSLEKYGISFGEATMEALIYFGQCGLPNSEVLRIATINAAQLLGDKSLGSLNTGSYADFVVYKDDPLKDLSVLKRPFKVFKAGQQFH